jgi:conflict system STAND superfamily ATPase/sulfatase-modifying factor enzyme 1
VFYLRLNKEETLTLKDDDGEVISKRVLDWLTGLITLAAALTTIFGVFFSEENAKPLAFGLALLLIVVSSGVFLYQRRQAAKLKITESPEPLSPSATLRGLLPFEEGDQLPGRARDIQELYTFVASSTFRFGVLWGESGCGKTSLMRAGLVPKLRNDKFLPLYIAKPTTNPQEAIRSALLREVSASEKQASKGLDQLLKSTAPKGKRIVILFDQFEEFFLTNRTPKSRASFIKWLGETIADESVPVEFLIGIRADFFAQLQNFAPHIPEPTSIHTTYQLQNFDIEKAKQIFSAAAKADAIPFEPELIQAVINELETEGFVRPAELQVVGTRLKRKNITRLNQYEALGGARGILSSYIGEEIKTSKNAQTARLVIRLMCADEVEAKSPTDLSLEDIARGISGREQTNDTTTFSNPEIIQAILKQFVAARLLIHTDDDKYNLVHDYLAPYVRAATEGTETNIGRANRLLKRYVAEYKEDPKTRIPFGRVRWIQKYASGEAKSAEKAQELLKRSKQAFYATIGSMVTVSLVIIYVLLASSFDFHLVDYVFGRNTIKQENPFIPLDNGDGLMIFGAETPNLKAGEQKKQIIPIESFEIQQTEVTNKQYRMCRRAGACHSDPMILEFYQEPAYDEHPVVYVNAFQAREFCHWLGGDLPTSVQWERAARGLEGRQWPWPGNGDPLDRANLYREDRLSNDTVKAKDFSSGATPEGILNLVGNVWEWTGTKLISHDNDTYYSLENWDGSESKVNLVLRGGSWGHPIFRITEVGSISPTDSDTFIGFRCILLKN